MRKSMGKKMFKRCIAFTMTAMMTGALLSGCQKENAGTDTSNTKEGESEVLTVWSNWKVSDQYSDQGDAPYWKAIEEACKVDLQFIDSTGGKDSLSILMGTDDLPDIIIEYDGTMPGGVQKALVDQSIIPLNELMESGHMPNFKAYLEKDVEADKLCRNDDGLYAWAPMIRKPDSPLAFNGNMVRKDWLDELNLKEPVTIQDMENVLLAFKEQKGCDAGYTFAWNNYQRIVMGFGICEGMYVEDNKVKYGFIEDKYKDFLSLFHSWMSKGILDPDGFTQNIDAFYAKIATGKTGLVWGNTGGELGKIETMKAETPEMNYQPIANPVLKEGDIFPVDISNYRVNNVGAMIAETCKNKEAAARVLDYVYGEEGNLRANFGEEGKTFDMVDGKPVLNDFVLKNPDGLSIQQALALYAGNNNKSFLVEREMMLQTYMLEVQKKSLDVWATPDAPIKQMPPVTLTSEEVQEYNEIITDITTYADEYKLKFIMGTESLDNFTQFVDNIKKMNIERAIEIQQTAYDRYSKR